MLEQRFIEYLLAVERAVLRRECLIFERFEFRRNVTFGILQCLSAAIVLGYFGRLRLRYFDVKAVYAVVFDFERGDSGGFSLTGFKCQQKVTAMCLDVSELVEFSIKPIGDHATIPDVVGGLRPNGRGQKIANTCAHRCVDEALGQLGQGLVTNGGGDKLLNQRDQHGPLR